MHAIAKCYNMSKPFIQTQIANLNSAIDRGIRYYYTRISYNPSTDTIRHQILYAITLPIAIIGISCRKPSYLLKYFPISFIAIAFILHPESLNPFQKVKQIK